MQNRISTKNGASQDLLRALGGQGYPHESSAILDSFFHSTTSTQKRVEVRVEQREKKLVYTLNKMF